MVKKIQIVLPLVQVLIAGALITHNLMGPPSSPHNPATSRADWILCDALDAPAALLRGWLENVAQQLRPDDEWRAVDRSAYLVIHTFGYLALVWLTWYWVSIEILRKQRILLASMRRIRVTGNIVALSIAPLLIAHWLNVSRYLGPNLFAVVVDALYLAWAAFLIVFYGRDLWFSVVRAR